jgi:cellulose synthase operon protein C
VESKSEPDNALLLGWYNHHRKNPQKALGWFKTALDRNGGPKAAEGYALTLWDLDRIGEAEAFAYEWRDKAPENLQAYLDIATALLSQDPPPRLDPPVVARVVPAITRKRFSNGAQALGWYSYNTGQVPTARQWFRTALSWKADDESSAYGAALASQRLNDRPGFNALVAQWRDRSPRIADLASGVAPGRAVPQPPVAAQTIVTQTVESAPATRAEPRIIHVERLSQAEGRRPQTRQASVRPGSGVRRNCTMTRNPGGLSADAALTLGWCLMELNRPLEAVAAFDRAVNNGSGRTREEAAYGKTLAYLRKDLTAQAALAASEAPQSIERRTELNATILAQRAIAAYRDGRFAETLLALGERGRIVPEQNDLMLIKGWSYFKLGHYNDAEKVFRAVQRTGYSEEANVGLNAILEKTQRVPQ